nr:MAG TPA: hypothetical protein [Caudoviricetes sp.]
MPKSPLRNFHSFLILVRGMDEILPPSNNIGSTLSVEASL